jgi:hypothetical protein
VLSGDAVTKKVTKTKATKTRAIETKKAPEKKPRPPMQLSVAVKGDQRLTENLILEVRAMAKRYGLETPNVEIVRRPRVGPKVKLTPGRKSK